MATLFIVCKLLSKRVISNIVFMLQVLLSVIMLAQLFVFITDHQDNMRAINELPIRDTIVLGVFEYYTMEEVAQELQNSPQIHSVGQVLMADAVCNGIQCNFALYSESIIDHYAPGLQSGAWLHDAKMMGDNGIPAVVSRELGLKAGDKTEIATFDENTRKIHVVGVLESPTQYLYPSGAASPEYFKASSIISQYPTIIIRDTDFGDTSSFTPPLDMPFTKNLFVFLKSGTDVHIAMKEWAKYGELTPMASLVSTYNRETSRLIEGGIIMFIVFMLLVATGILSNNIMQMMKNRKLFTIYYLLGMNWHKSVAVEICRTIFLIGFTMALSIVAGKSGLLMIQWMTPAREFLFYGVVLLYIVVMFGAVGAYFVFRLIHEDISESLKELQHGE